MAEVHTHLVIEQKAALFTFTDDNTPEQLLGLIGWEQVRSSF